MMAVKATAPASAANLGPGFDVFAVALDVGLDVVEVERRKDERIIIKVEGEYADGIPENVEGNCAGRVALAFMRKIGETVGLNIRVFKGVKPGSGLGSSAATSAATAVALNALLGLNLDVNSLVELASQGEVASAGAAHADNVAASILGGFAIVRSYSPLDVYSVPPPRNVVFVVATPNIHYTTEEARRRLPKVVELRRMITQVGNASTIVLGFIRGDAKLIGRSMVDHVVEPVRAELIPGYSKARRAALSAGAEGVTISGAGPSVLAVVDPSRVNPLLVSNALREAFLSEGVECASFVARVAEGAKVMEVR